MPTVVVKDLGLTDYEPVFSAMREYTAGRDQASEDQLWFTQHQPVFTQGQAGKAEHVLAAGDIPVVQTDRGGQVTYHGPGQIVGYLLFDLKRLGLTVRGLVTGIEQAVVALLKRYGIRGVPRPDAPGVYVDGAKIAALGLRVRHGYSYHGLALNVCMDLEPFARINPCGMADLTVTQICDLGGPDDLAVVQADLLAEIADVYGVTARTLGSADSCLV